jgi:hypothetical protein
MIPGIGNFNPERWQSEQPLDWPEAVINLIDAIRDYLRTEEVVGRDLYVKVASLKRSTTR